MNDQAVDLEAVKQMQQKTWSEGDFAMIEASDTGEGITAETASQAFGPFFTTQRNPAKGPALAA